MKGPCFWVTVALKLSVHGWTWDGESSVKRLLIDPHEGPRLVGFALILDTAEFVAELAVLPLVVVVVFCLPNGLEGSGLVKLDRKNCYFQNVSEFLLVSTMILIGN